MTLNLRSFITLSGLLLSSTLFAVAIKDVPKSDPNAAAIQKVVNEGYFSLYQNNTFQSDQPLTRREAAIIIDKLLAEMDGSGITLSKTELQELSNLSKSFKTLLTEQDLHNSKVDEDLTTVKAEQKVIQHDLSLAYGTFNTTKGERESLLEKNATFMSDFSSFKQKTYDHQVSLWIGVGVAALLGILL